MGVEGQSVVRSLLKRAKGIFAWWNKSNDCLELVLVLVLHQMSWSNPSVFYAFALPPSFVLWGFPLWHFLVFWKEKRWLQIMGICKRAKGIQHHVTISNTPSLNMWLKSSCFLMRTHKIGSINTKQDGHDGLCSYLLLEPKFKRHGSGPKWTNSSQCTFP